MTTFDMDYGNLDSIVPWMDNNYRNSDLQLCFPLEKNIANLPVDNFPRMGLMDFIVKYRPNLDPSNMVGKLWPLLGSQCYFGLGPVVFLTLLIYLFVSIELEFSIWAKLVSVLTLLGWDFVKTISEKWNVQSLGDSVQLLVHERPHRRQHLRQRRRRRHRARRCGPRREWIAPLDHQSPSLMPGCLRIWNTGYWLGLILKYTPILISVLGDGVGGNVLGC